MRLKRDASHAGGAFRKAKRGCSSSALLGMGVPVSAHRRSPLSARTALHCEVARFLM